MNLRNLFKHKRLEERTADSSRLEKGLVYAEEGLVYAISHDNPLPSWSSIYLYVNGTKDLHLCDRWHTVTSLCAHNNWLYDGGYEPNGNLGFVIDTITGKDVMERKNNTVYTLCSHNGKLYRGDCYGNIYEVSTMKMVAVRYGKVTTLCSHEGVLYDGGFYKGMYDTFRNEASNKKKCVSYLCSDKNSLYGVDYKHDNDFYFNGNVFDVKKGKKIKDIDETPTSICSYKGELYYTYRGFIRRLSDGDVIFCDKRNISAVCSIPAELTEQIKHTKNYGFNFNEVQRINPKGAIEYLTNIMDSQERRRVIEQLFNYDKVHEDVIDWLNEHEKDLMRKAAFY